MQRTKREETMPATMKSETERARVQHAALTKHYRAIGPAAVLAALVCMRKPAKKGAKAA